MLFDCLTSAGSVRYRSCQHELVSSAASWSAAGQRAGPRNKLQATFRRVQAAGFGIALVTESARSVTVANVVYREIVDYQRVFDFVLAYRTRERAPAVLAFIETCKGLQASRDQKRNRAFRRPLAEGEIGGDDDRNLLAELADQVEEELAIPPSMMCN
jgi:hypothetical protein